MSIVSKLMFTMVTPLPWSFIRQTDRQLPLSIHVTAHVHTYQTLLLKFKKKTPKKRLMFHEFFSLVHLVKIPHRWTWHWLSLYRFLLWTALSTSAEAVVMVPCCPGALGQQHHGVVWVGTGFTVRVTWLVNSKPKLLFSAQGLIFLTFFFSLQRRSVLL